MGHLTQTNQCHVVKVNLSYQDCFKELKHGAKNIRKSQAYDF